MMSARENVIGDALQVLGVLVAEDGLVRARVDAARLDNRRAAVRELLEEFAQFCASEHVEFFLCGAAAEGAVLQEGFLSDEYSVDIGLTWEA